MARDRASRLIIRLCRRGDWHPSDNALKLIRDELISIAESSKDDRARLGACRLLMQLDRASNEKPGQRLSTNAMERAMETAAARG